MHVIVSFCRQASNAVNELDAAGIKARRQLWCAAVFCALFMVNEHTFIRATAYLCFLSQIGELLGGYYANSLSLMTDAAHLLSDLAGFLISIFALVCKTEFLFHLLLNPLFFVQWLASQEATAQHSFGFHRAEILGALLSVLLIWALTGVLVYEGISRVMDPPG